MYSLQDKTGKQQKRQSIITQEWGTFTLNTVSWKSNRYYIFWVCVCSLRYPACNAHAPYCHLWPVRMCSIFQHYLI